MLLLELLYSKETRMKKFLTIAPQQGNGMLSKQLYVPEGNSQLEYGETSFPIIPVINAYAEPDEDIQIICLTYENENCKHNRDILQAEAESLCAAKNISMELVSIDAPFDDSVSALLSIYARIIDCMQDDDELYACITYGSKPASLMLIMALQYAYRLRNNVYIDCVVYGQMDRRTTPPTARIYDVTALIQMDEVANLMASGNASDPDYILRTLTSKE